MKLTYTSLIIILSLCLFNLNSYAQTQAEIEQMLNGSTQEDKTKSKKEKVEKTEKSKVDKSAEQVAEKTEEAEVVLEEVKEVLPADASDNLQEDASKNKKQKDSKEPLAVEVEQEETAKELPVVEEEKAASPTRSSSSGSFAKPYRTWSLGVFGGLTNPVTDIRYKDFFGAIDPINENQWNAGLRVTKMFDAAFGLQFQASYNVVQGAFDSLVIHKEDRNYLEAAGINKGVYFKNNVIASSMNIYWNISNTVFGVNRYIKSQQQGRPIKARKFSLYMYTGIGGTWFDPHVMFIEDKAPAEFAGVEFKQDRTFEVNIPMALGTKFKLGNVADLGIEYVFNYVFTDKLDGFAYDHPGRIKNDLYTNLNLSLEFKLGTKKKDKDHIEWVSPFTKIYEEIAKIDKMEKTLKQLTKDEDEDGVSDYFDKDTETPEGTVVDGSGRALDSDGDGIPDKADLEPFSDKGAEVDEFGQALDDDGDGVPNHKDLEANSPKGSFVNFQGIAIDGKVKGGESRGLSFPSIFFDTDQATIKREYEDELFMIAKDILRLEDLTFLLSGHCDERGSDEYNYELGMRRAEAVKSYLVDNYGIDANRLEVVSKGKSEIQSPRFHINRRVEVLIIEK
ncbi:MAG: OmpA family protein [Chitinophagales bacterium]|nr:OmpA family protein [Chitinophagales bacterium]